MSVVKPCSCSTWSHRLHYNVALCLMRWIYPVKPVQTIQSKWTALLCKLSRRLKTEITASHRKYFIVNRNQWRIITFPALPSIPKHLQPSPVSNPNPHTQLIKDKHSSLSIPAKPSQSHSRLQEYQLPIRKWHRSHLHRVRLHPIPLFGWYVYPIDGFVQGVRLGLWIRMTFVEDNFGWANYVP